LKQIKSFETARKKQAIPGKENQ